MSDQNAPAVIDLDDVASWPADILAYLKAHERVLVGWNAEPKTTSAWAYDATISGMESLAARYFLKGLHCTRLTRGEIDAIRRDGMGLPDGEMVANRVNALLETGEVDGAFAQELVANHLYGDGCRAGMLWVCFFEPGKEGEHAIGELLGCWGGEALYRGVGSHQRLMRIGVPCLIEVVVRIGDLGHNTAMRLCEIYLKHLGHKTEPTEFEDYTTAPVPATHVTRIIEFPSDEFVRLTGCDRWSEPLVLSENGETE